MHTYLDDDTETVTFDCTELPAHLHVIVERSFLMGKCSPRVNTAVVLYIHYVSGYDDTETVTFDCTELPAHLIVERSFLMGKCSPRVNTPVVLYIRIWIMTQKRRPLTALSYQPT